ncbi:MAG: hypothetical protein U9N76_06155 [Candidatus Marinimicrobia bacterium]|nr:hypothetical protein [Candidatus Neomarinimicrobiota bacterium]
MKNLFKLMIILLIVSSVFATNSRIVTLGGRTAIVRDDDRNINLFPQRINDGSLIRFEGINTGAPNFLFTFGENSKWGFYGGNNQVNDFLNIYKGIGENSAIKLGLAMGIESSSDEDSNEEPSPGNISTLEEMKSRNIGVDFQYGSDFGDTEFSTSIGFINGPNLINNLGQNINTYSLENTFGTVTTTNEGNASGTLLAFDLQIRKPANIMFFENLYSNTFAGFLKTNSHYEPNNVVVEHESYSDFFAISEIILFNEVGINDSMFTIYYGTGFNGAFQSIKDIDTVGHTEDTFSGFGVGGPTIMIGTEIDVKYFVFRFGVRKNINIFDFTKEISTSDFGTEDDIRTIKNSDILSNGNYVFSSGLGFSYKKFTVNLQLNNAFWVTGPQMILSGTGGTLGASADVIYEF